jgi:environmental stress-induced protein Ves
MYTLEVRPAASRTVTPWKNGQGSTAELAKHPPEADLGRADFLWRVSIATIKESGPFSSFPGYDRHIALLSGEPPVLVHEEGDRLTRFALEPLQPHLFSGDWTTRCELPGGPCRDFNVIAHRGATLARVEPVVSEVAVTRRRLLSCDWHLLYVEAGSMRVTQGAAAQDLTAGDVLMMTRQIHEGEMPAAIELQPDASGRAAGFLVSIKST